MYNKRLRKIIPMMQKFIMALNYDKRNNTFSTSFFVFLFLLFLLQRYCKLHLAIESVYVLSFL